MSPFRSSPNPFTEWVQETLDSINDPFLTEDQKVLRKDSLHQLLYVLMGDEVLRSPPRDRKALQDLSLVEWLEINGVAIQKKMKKSKKKGKPCLNFTRAQEG